MAKEKSYWEVNGRRRYVLDPEDVGKLEGEAGVHEFVGRNPRDKAEDMAYEDYTKRHHKEAAAHHLVRMKAAQANGNYSDAKRHKVLYDMHIKEMGLNSEDGKVPSEIAEHMQNPDAPRPMKFAPHRADAFFLNKDDGGEKMELSKKEVASRLAELIKRVIEKNQKSEDAGGTVPSNMQADFGMSEHATLGDQAWDDLTKHGEGLKRLVAGIGAATALGAGAGYHAGAQHENASMVDKVGHAVVGGVAGQGLGVYGTIAGASALDALRARARRRKGALGKGAIAEAPQTPAPGVVKPKEHIVQAYNPNAPVKRAATTTQRRRGLLVPWQIEGTGVAAKPSSLKMNEGKLDKAVATGPQIPAPGVAQPAADDFEDTVDTAIPEQQRMWRYSSAPVVLPGKGKKVPAKVAKKDIDPKDLEEGSADEQEEHKLGPTLSTKIAADHLKEDPAYYDKSELNKARYRSSREDPDDHGNPKEIEWDRNDDLRRKQEREARERARPGYVSDEPTYKGEKPYMGRDEGIRRSKLPPGAPGASKDGVGVHVDRKKEANKKAARGKVKNDD